MKKLIILFLFVLFVALVVGFEGDNCEGKAEVCVADCNDECGLLKWDYCQEHDYSGCALDVFCYCNVCKIYDSKWCPEYNDYRACVEGIKGTYISCIESCQASREAGLDVSTCWNDCNKVFEDDIIECKQDPCHEFCIEKGYETGKWARYTQEYGWDSCLCENKVRDEVKDPEPLDIPKAYHDLVVVEEETPKEKPGLFTTLKDKIKWLFTKQEKIKKTRSGMIRAIKNKKEVKIFRENKKKWYPVGISTPLYPGDILRIGPNGRAQLRLWESDVNSYIVDLLPNTLYSVPDPNDRYSGKYPVSVLIKGVVKTVIRRLRGQKSDFYIKTPTVVLGIRGTEFILGHDNETKTDRIMVYEGVVDINNETIVEAGEQIKFYNGVPGNIEPLDEEEWNTLTEEDWDQVYSPSIFTIPIVKIGIVILLGGTTYFFLKKKGKKKQKQEKKSKKK